MTQNFQLVESPVMEMKKLNQSTWNRYHFLAVIGFACGVIAGLSGLILTVIAWFGATNSYAGLGTLGTLFVVAMFPLLALGAYALDKIDDIINERNEFKKVK